jgi:sigma-B regulation protein RsbU (phosphoserine phosphatase)
VPAKPDVEADAANATELAGLRARIAELERAEAEARLAVSELRQRDEREHAVARRIQESLMPRAFPSLPGYRVAARYRAAREIGGDIYDVYPSRPERQERLGLAVADVTGKGVTAALLMAFCRAIMRTAAWASNGPADTLARVNRVLATDVRSGLFVTAIVAELDAASSAVRWASAGHEPPILIRPSGTVSELPVGGTMLGLMAGAAFEEQHRHLRPGETFLMLTDGITDASDRRGRRLGTSRLRRVLRVHRDAEPDDLLDAIVAAVDTFAGGTAQADDLTLMALRRSG